MDTPNKSSTQRIGLSRLVAAEVVLTLGVVVAACFEGLGIMVGYFLMNCSGWFLPFQHFSRPLGRKDMVWTVVILTVFGLFLFAAIRFLPGESLVWWMRHPAILTLLWTIFTAMQIRLWWRSGEPAPTQPQAA